MTNQMVCVDFFRNCCFILFAWYYLSRMNILNWRCLSRIFWFLKNSPKGFSTQSLKAFTSEVKLSHSHHLWIPVLISFLTNFMSKKGHALGSFLLMHFIKVQCCCNKCKGTIWQGFVFIGDMTKLHWRIVAEYGMAGGRSHNRLFLLFPSLWRASFRNHSMLP
jgi:hypothetical protein